MSLMVATMPDADLAIDSGDAQALTSLYLKTGRAAVAKTAALVGGLQAAEDIVQDVFARLWRARIRFPSEKSGFLWIYKSCHRAGIDYLRSGRVRFEADGLDQHSDAPAADTEAMLHNRRLLLTCLAHLDAREGDILAYLYIDGMTQQEVATFLGLSRKTIQRVVDRVERKLTRFKEVGV